MPLTSESQSTGLRVGLTYNLKRVKPGPGGVSDLEAEYDSISTIHAIRSAIESFGHEVVELEALPDLPQRLLAAAPDFVFNLAEGHRGRNREAQVPALLELVGIPYTGSDTATMVLTLDKALAKQVVRQAGVATPNFIVMTRGDEELPPGMSFPAILKPVAEGSSKGISPASVVRNEEELRRSARALIARYGQGALVEEFLPGREFTIALLGGPTPRVLTPMEIIFTRPAEFPIYTFDHKLEFTSEVRYDVQPSLDPLLSFELEKMARASFQALGCRDVARIDVRLDRNGHPNFIECNPLPGLTPDFSDLCLITNAAGISYRELIGKIMEPAIERRALALPEPRPLAHSSLREIETT